MRTLFILFISLFSSFHLFSQDANSIIREAERLEAIPNETAAFFKYREAIKLQPGNVYLLNKCSELCSRLGKRQNNNVKRDDYYAAAKIYAEAALKLSPNNSEANCVMAIALGRSALTKSSKEKIAISKEIKHYLDISLKNDPQNFKAWHVLGRWNYELTNLNFLERAAVRLLYGGLPDASLKASEEAFERSKVIAPWFILNYLEMAKAYKSDGKNDKAIAALNEMFLQKNTTEDDPYIKQLGKDLLKELL